jgi:hypothetical protein
MTAHQDLIQDTITGSTAIATSSTTCLGDRVQLVKEHDTRCGSTSLVKDIADIGLGLSEPHGKELGTLDGDEVGLALVGNTASQQDYTSDLRLGQQGLSGTRGSIEENTFGR